MTLADLTAGAGWTLAPSPPETERFGLEVARLVVRPGAAADEDGLRRDLAACPADLVIARYPADDTAVPALLAAVGRDVLPAGALTYWALLTDRVVEVDRPPGVVVRPATELDPALASELLRGVVAATFAGYGNHYSVNPLLEAELALDGYVEWALSCLGSPDCLVHVMTVEGQPAAVATCALGGSDLEILLAGVMPAFQARGLYSSLLAAVATGAREEGRSRVVISTQVQNTRVQRAWARFGFEPVAAFETVHLVRRGLLPAPHQP